MKELLTSITLLILFRGISATIPIIFGASPAVLGGSNIAVSLTCNPSNPNDTCPETSCPIYCSGDKCQAVIHRENGEEVANLVLAPKERTVNASIPTFIVGLIKLLTNCTNETQFHEVSVYKADYLNTISVIVGWIYFLAWSISFYPQVWINYKRRSVVGLNFDFVCLNLMGFTCYSIFNIGLFFLPVIQQEYREKTPLSNIPVESNDVFFALHAVTLTAVVIIQILIYDRGGQRVAKWAIAFMTIAVFASGIFAILCVAHKYSWLSFLYFLSYVKLTITIIKYIPQAWFNFKRKSTVGWSIENILLDLTGGVLSILQMVILSVNYDDWVSIWGNPVKVGLGFFSIFFDILFITQHYVLYRKPKDSTILVSEEGRDSHFTRSGSNEPIL